MKRTNGHIGIVLLLAAGLLAGCAGSGDEPTTGGGETTQKEIRLTPDVWRVMDAAGARQQGGTRAATFDNATALQAEASFTCSAYEAGTTTGYFTGATVEWNNRISSGWAFTTAKYWPAPVSNAVPAVYPFDLDFFAYMPATPPAYITSGPTYSAPGSPGVPQASFVCTLPMAYNSDSPTAGQGSSLQEFIWSITVGQNKDNQGGSGVAMRFCHPFARIRFQLSASHPDIQINSITFKKLKTGGTCTLNATGIADDYYYTNSAWSSLTPAEGSSNLVMTLASKDGEGEWVAADVNTFNSNPASVVPIGGWSESAHQYVNLLVVPQVFAGQIEVNATWVDRSITQTVTATISSITWQAGKSYTYTFTISPHDLIVNTEKYTEQW